MLNIRTATVDDSGLVLEFIRELADYEKMLDDVVATLADINTAIEDHQISVLIADWNGKPAGFAFYFFNFSTFTCKPGLYLEDLFVKPDYRGHSIGKALLSKLAEIALDSDCSRLEWMVLDWNKPAINFYRKLGAESLDGWTKFRLDGDQLNALTKQT